MPQMNELSWINLIFFTTVFFFFFSSYLFNNYVFLKKSLNFLVFKYYSNLI